MQRYKHKIKASFNRAAATYDQYSQLQQQQCIELLKATMPFVQKPPKKIIDVGCGTGNSTLYLYNNFPYKELYAIDFSEKLLAQVKQKLPTGKVHCMMADFDQLSSSYKNFDLIFSNMVLHWSLDLESTLRSLVEKLSPGGILAFSLPLERTFSEIKSKYRNVFPTAVSISRQLRELKLQVLVEQQSEVLNKFPSPLQALRSLKKVGSNCVINNVSTCFSKSALKEIVGIETDLQKEFSLTYRMGLFVVKR